LIFIFPIITTLHGSLIFQGIRPDAYCVPKYEYFMVEISVQNVFLGTLHLPRYKNMYIAVAQLVEALGYNPGGRGFDSRCCRWD